MSAPSPRPAGDRPIAGDGAAVDDLARYVIAAVPRLTGVILEPSLATTGAAWDAALDRACWRLITAHDALRDPERVVAPREGNDETGAVEKDERAELRSVREIIRGGEMPVEAVPIRACAGEIAAIAAGVDRASGGRPLEHSLAAISGALYGLADGAGRYADRVDELRAQLWHATTVAPSREGSGTSLRHDTIFARLIRAERDLALTCGATLPG